MAETSREDYQQYALDNHASVTRCKVIAGDDPPVCMYVCAYVYAVREDACVCPCVYMHG